MTAERRGGASAGVVDTSSAMDDFLQVGPQRVTSQAALFLVPALAAVTSSGISGGMQTGEGLREHGTGQKQVAESFSQAAGTIMFFDGHDSPLFPDARGEVGGNSVDGQHPHTPYLDVIEQLLITHIVQAAQDRPHA